jgi:hypothetical protein
MRSLRLILVLALLGCVVRPAPAQVSLPTAACPRDRTDGPLYADGTTYYGIPARGVVEAFLAPPHETHGRIDSGTQQVDASSLRVLVDVTDASACRRLSFYLSNGSTSAPDGRSVYFAAEGFYFVAQWRPAMALSSYRTGYSRVMVFDSAFTIRGVYAF